MTPIAKRILHSTKRWVRYISVGLLLSGCTSLNPQPTVVLPNIPTPTVSSLYDDALNADWSAERSSKAKYDVASTAFIHSGKKAIMVTPTGDFGQFSLTVRKGAQKIYPRDRILGISFWLNGGENSIATSDLAVTVTGSNQYTYWVADDTSIKVDAPVTADTPLFPETRLYYLDINRTIPPNTWTEVILWLDDQVYDPEYTYITGMYIKNDKDILT